MNNETRTLSLITQLVTTEGKTLNITVYACYGPLILKNPITAISEMCRGLSRITLVA